MQTYGPYGATIFICRLSPFVSNVSVKGPYEIELSSNYDQHKTKPKCSQTFHGELYFIYLIIFSLSSYLNVINVVCFCTPLHTTRLLLLRITLSKSPAYHQSRTPCSEHFSIHAFIETMCATKHRLFLSNELADLWNKLSECSTVNDSDVSCEADDSLAYAENKSCLPVFCIAQTEY